MRKVVISVRASYDIEDLFDYLDHKWSINVRKKVAQNLKSNIEKIRINPELFPNTNYLDVRKCVVSKQISIIYNFDSTEINILRIFDTLQDPTKINNIK